MPIKFEAPAPIGAVVRAQQNAGPSLAEQYAAEMHARSQADISNAQLQQNDRQFQDHLQEQRFQFAAQNAYSPRDEGMAQAAQAQQQQRFQLQADLNQTEMTQAENMRLQRLKQGVDAVHQERAEGRINDEERDRMISQISTGINPLEMKKAASQVKAQDMHNQMLDQQFKDQVKKQKDLEAFQSMNAQDKVARVLDPEVQAEVWSELQRNPAFQALSPEQQDAEVRTETAKRPGGVVTIWQAEPGKWAKFNEGKGGSGAGGASGKGDLKHSSGATFDQYQKIYHEEAERARKDAMEVYPPDSMGEKKRVRNIPEGELEKWIKDRTQQGIDERLKEFAKTPGLPSGQPGIGGGAGAGAPGPKAEPKPFNTATMEGADETQKVQVSAMIKAADRIRAMPNLDENEKSRLVGDVAAMRNLFAKYGSPQALERKASAGDKQAKEDWALWQHCNERIDRLAPLPPDQHPAVKAANEGVKAIQGLFKPVEPPPPPGDNMDDPGRYQVG